MDAALAELQSLPGIGPWTAQAVLLRGCGVADELPIVDAISRDAVRWAYGLDESPGRRHLGPDRRRLASVPDVGHASCSTWPGDGPRPTAPSYRQG